MKKIVKYNIIVSFVVMIALLASCTKDLTQVKLEPEIETSQVEDISSYTAVITGFVVASGDGYSEKGICYNKTGDPTIDDEKMIYEGDDNNATFKVTLTGLDYNTKYYARAYGINTSGVVYGSDTTFTTLPILATLTTDTATDITGFSATSGGEITDAGGAEITDRGVCWSTLPNPVIDNDSLTSDGTGIGTFTSSITGLNGLTTYYVKAYAISSAGVSYGNEISFTTPIAHITWYVPGDHQGWNPATAPTVENTVSDPNTLSGYVWLNTEFKFTPAPNWDNSWGDDGADGTLDAGGANIAVPSPGYYLITVDFTAKTYTLTKTDWGLIGGAVPPYDWTVDQNMTYSSVTGTWLLTLSLNSGDMKFRANDEWVIDYGDTGADGSLEQGGDNIPVATAGDYTVTLDLSHPNNYTYSLNQWGIIGSSVPPYDWTADVNMSIVPGTNQWTVTEDLVVGEFKFRANDAWNVDYGDTGADGSLEPGGDNIPVTTAGNYTITIDLSTLTYTMVQN
ncbi:MAG: SusF/SusE family outer membrane protein [Chlorobi bacterium]|nr:SusF/SusE family outer membrane protein [Chlorobiota bacterium]